MKCFVHRDADAVGICKSCQKGLCAACAADLGKGLACKGRCEEEVQALNRMVERTRATYRRANQAKVFCSLFLLASGVIILGTGLTVVARLANTPLNFVTIIGGAFSLFGLVYLVLPGFPEVKAKPTPPDPPG